MLTIKTIITSGGHLNPAVTFALACAKKTSWKKVPFFILAQYMGAFCASAMIFFVYYGTYIC